MGTFDEYYPWDKGFGSAANSARWRKMAQLWAPDGVVANYPVGQSGWGLGATLSGGTATVTPGACFIHGYYAEIFAQQAVPVGASGTIVARADLDNEVCSIIFHSGAVDYNGYQQDVHAWEIPLWLVSSGSLTDLRCFISGGGAVGWSGTMTQQPVNSGLTINFNFMYPRFSYPAQVQLRATGAITFTDASSAQSAICQISYEYGQSDNQTSLTPVVTPASAGGGPSGVPISVPISLSASLPVTTGKKSIGCLVTAGTGPQILFGPLTMLINQVHLGTQTAS
jgi:hypothetical protein